MKNKTKTIIIAKDGFPLEEIMGHPIINYFRRLLLGSHRECRQCYESRTAMKNTGVLMSPK